MVEGFGDARKPEAADLLGLISKISTEYRRRANMCERLETDIRERITASLKPSKSQLGRAKAIGDLEFANDDGFERLHGIVGFAAQFLNGEAWFSENGDIEYRKDTDNGATS
jgi:hypothetical protein